MSVCRKVESIETARTAVGGIRALDQCGCSEIRVRWQIPEGLVAQGRKVLIALDHIERLCSSVKAVATFDHSCTGSKWGSDKSEKGEVFHACGWVSKANWVVPVWVFCRLTNPGFYSFEDRSTLSEKGERLARRETIYRAGTPAPRWQGGAQHYKYYGGNGGVGISSTTLFHLRL